MKQLFSRQVATVYLPTLCQFRSAFGIYFANSMYTGYRGNSVISGLGPGSVFKMLFSLASKVILFCSLHFSERKGGSGLRSGGSGEFIY